MTPLELIIPFGLGLVSSLHCAQMCGPIVMGYSLAQGGSFRGGLWAHLSYNLGRVSTYALMGAVAGMAGEGMTFLGHLAGIERFGAIVAGVAMVVAGLLMAGWFPRGVAVWASAGMPAWFSSAAGRLLRSADVGSRFLLGLLLGFLPCGLIYAALLKSVDTGSPGAGALTMMSFGLGTAGILIVIGMFSTAIPFKMVRYANTLASVSVLLMGAYLLWRGFNPPAAAKGCHGDHTV